MKHLNRIRQLRASSRVKRYHTMTIVGQNDVAQHSWGVAMILHELCSDWMSADAYLALVMAALTHDLDEYFTGDIPATAKWRWPYLKDALKVVEAEIKDEESLPDCLSELKPEEYATLKVADTLDCILFCNEQLKLGNRTDEVIRTMTVSAAFVTELIDSRKLHDIVAGRARRILHDLVLEWEDTTMTEALKGIYE